MEKINTFETLNNVNLKDKTKEKIGLRYLSWADAWTELKKMYPDAKRTIYKRTAVITERKTLELSDGTKQTTEIVSEQEIPYFTDGRTCTVRVGVTINDVEYIEELPVMDNKNRAIRVEAVTSVDVNRAVQRCFVKACALHGLGLYIYAGEDLPEVDRVTIDYDSLKQNADLPAQWDEAAFKAMQQETIDMVQNSGQLDAGAGDQIFSYTTELFPNKRLSVLTFAEDGDNLIKLHTFLKRLYAIKK